MSISMVYILPMILGRTFDVRNDRVGVDIFPPKELEKISENLLPKSDSTYKMIKNSQDVQNVLGVSGDLSVKVKAGVVDIKGAGTYLKNTANTENTVEVLTKMQFYTSTVYLSFDAKPFPQWTNHRLEDLGTHYVRSITYGGELIASLKFVAHKTEYLQDIQAKVSANIQGVKLESLVVSGALAKLKKDLQHMANMEITYFATVPLKSVPNTVEGLQILVESFREHVQSINNGTGVPVRVDLVELSNLDDKFTFLMNKPLQTALPNFENKFDDLRKTKKRMTEWIRSLPPSLTKEQEMKINDLYERVNNALRSFHNTIGQLDVEKGIAQLEESEISYRKNGGTMPGKFYREFEKMKHEMKVKEPEATDLGRSVYIRWGSHGCNETTSSHIFTGYVASGAEMGVGGGSGYLCLPRDPNVGERIEVPLRSGSFVSGVKYGITESGVFINKEIIFGKGVLCSACHVGNRSSVITKPASIDCPSGWIMEYKGFMAATKDTGHRSSYVCLDEHPDHYSAIEARNTDQNLLLVGKEDGEDNSRVIIPCVVCSK